MNEKQLKDLSYVYTRQGTKLFINHRGYTQMITICDAELCGKTVYAVGHTLEGEQIAIPVKKLRKHIEGVLKQ